jgi:hypothetical protein
MITMFHFIHELFSKVIIIPHVFQREFYALQG